MGLSELSFGLDIFILFFLVFTIYYAIKLSKSLSSFRMQKDEFKALIRDLNTHIDKAQQAIADLKAVTNTPQGGAVDVLEDARGLIEELKLITESGNSLAERLEKSAVSASKVHKRPEPFPNDFLMDDYGDVHHESEIGISDFVDTLDKIDPEQKPVQRSTEMPPEPPSFFIQDREYDEPAEPPLGSQAEQELFEALRGRRKKKG